MPGLGDIGPMLQGIGRSRGKQPVRAQPVDVNTRRLGPLRR